MPVALCYEVEPDGPAVPLCSGCADRYPEPAGEINRWDLDDEAPVVRCDCCGGLLYVLPLFSPADVVHGIEHRDQEPMRHRLSLATGLDFIPEDLGGHLFGWVAEVSPVAEMIVSPDTDSGAIDHDQTGRPATYTTRPDRCGWSVTLTDAGTVQGEWSMGNTAGGMHDASDASFACRAALAVLGAYRQDLAQ